MDIFSVNLPLTEPTVIVGNGPLGNNYVGLIPDHIYTISLNGAIKHKIHHDLWVCTSPEAPGINPDWWEYGLNSGVPSLMDRRMNYNADYTCRQYAYGKAPERLGEKYLVAGGSVVGVVTDMLVKQGCKHIVYCGVDMTGGAHADGSPCNINRHGVAVSGDTWGYKRSMLQKIIDRAMGVNIESLSPTLLDVPRARRLLTEWGGKLEYGERVCFGANVYRK